MTSLTTKARAVAASRPNRRLRFGVQRLRAADPSDRPAALQELLAAWDNSFSADVGYLTEAFERVRSASVGVLECGSGLSTLVCAVAAEQSGVPVVSLEHDRFWAGVTKFRLRLAGVRSDVRYAALRSYGDQVWYDPPAAVRAARFDVVICDGPPGRLAGSRVGLVPVMGAAVAGAVILLDDADRPGEQATLRAWQEMLGAEVDLRGGGDDKQFAVVRPSGHRTTPDIL